MYMDERHIKERERINKLRREKGRPRNFPGVCEWCAKPFMSTEKSTRFCSRTCSSKHKMQMNPLYGSGDKNPNWKGGISRNKYHYKIIQKNRHPQAWEARKIYYAALKRGDLKRQPCEVCGKEKADGHHDDYSRPLEIRWLCNKHHREVHGGMKWNVRQKRSVAANG